MGSIAGRPGICYYTVLYALQDYNRSGFAPPGSRPATRPSNLAGRNMDAPQTRPYPPRSNAPRMSCLALLIITDVLPSITHGINILAQICIR